MKYFSRNQLHIPNETAKQVNFNFSHYISIETLGCHNKKKQKVKDYKNTIHAVVNFLFKVIASPNIGFRDEDCWNFLGESCPCNQN